MIGKSFVHWRGPILLLLLGGLNVAFGALQLDTIFTGVATADEIGSTIYFESPVPIVSHIIAGILFNLLGPFQFAPTLRARWPKLHRISGRIWMLSGLIVALSALWMNEFFPAYGAPLKYSGVVISSAGLILAQGIALHAILNRKSKIHRTWMMRAFAFGLGPATQRLFVMPYFFAFGIPSDFVIGLVVWSGFLINLAVVEWILIREGTVKMASLQQPIGEI